MSPVLLFGSRSLLSFEYTRPYDKIKWKFEKIQTFFPGLGYVSQTDLVLPLRSSFGATSRSSMNGRFVRLRQTHTRNSDRSESNVRKISDTTDPFRNPSSPLFAEPPRGEVRLVLQTQKRLYPDSGTDGFRHDAQTSCCRIRRQGLFCRSGR